jgi:hypothetical protein
VKKSLVISVIARSGALPTGICHGFLQFRAGCWPVVILFVCFKCLINFLSLKPNPYENA